MISARELSRAFVCDLGRPSPRPSTQWFWITSFSIDTSRSFCASSRSRTFWTNAACRSSTLEFTSDTFIADSNRARVLLSSSRGSEALHGAPEALARLSGSFRGVADCTAQHSTDRRRLSRSRDGRGVIQSQRQGLALHLRRRKRGCMQAGAVAVARAILARAEPLTIGQE